MPVKANLLSPLPGGGPIAACVRHGICQTRGRKSRCQGSICSRLDKLVKVMGVPANGAPEGEGLRKVATALLAPEVDSHFAGPLGEQTSTVHAGKRQPERDPPPKTTFAAPEETGSTTRVAV